MKKLGLGQPNWNAHQVYTWVYTRNPRLVVLLSDRDEGDSFDPNPIDFFAMTHRPGAEFANYAEAQKSIVSTLQEGRLRSLGRREGVGTFGEIPAVEWIDLHFIWHVFHGAAEAVSMTDNPPASIVGAPRWHGLRFKRDEVLELWPPTETEIKQAESDNDAAQSDTATATAALVNIKSSGTGPAREPIGRPGKSTSPKGQKPRLTDKQWCGLERECGGYQNTAGQQKNGWPSKTPVQTVATAAGVSRQMVYKWRKGPQYRRGLCWLMTEKHPERVERMAADDPGFKEFCGKPNPRSAED